ncbi:ATP-dependent RecD-like DNA helicase [Candidatus Methylospira mobilis]|uniref:ATP-dependent RecD-like DNA helicase n=1 Tax=Candidatus Methylospira mobilis TaxID=1808979 RepID=UPI0028E70E8C|nr:ATP-dependent RecD-like DNA helicase [Candidatus Methylospira mobilis]WNV03853.1 ATP-dependent RecD-like DNA helicase [Candidatus Methylospira mobilis]
MSRNYEELKAWAKKLGLEEVFNISKNQNISGTDKRIAYSIAQKLKSGDMPSFKQLRQLERIYSLVHADTKQTAHAVNNLAFNASQEAQDIDIKHLCLRTAWHDDRWNGNICKHPERNDFCIGEYSLLSDRIRHRRKLEIENQPACAGCKSDSPNLGEYQPPCFWSINLFGNHSLKFQHDNPVAPDFPKIMQELPPYSLISWPFKLAFVKSSDEEKKKYGNYYPKEIFENRIRIFQRDVKPAQSVVFTYCNYSNPISGEDMKYLVTGCALLADQGKPEYFDITKEQLAKKAEELRQPNFPSMNWALRYTLDFEGTGIRIPYHEYLDKFSDGSGISEDFLKAIAVTVDEPELKDGFTFVAKHIDDDQAIYLLMKIRRSLLKVLEHGFVDYSETESQLKKVDDLIKFTWNKRGYLPGLKNLLLAIPGVKEHYFKRVNELLDAIDLADQKTVIDLRDALGGKSNSLAEEFDDLLTEVQEFMNEHSIKGEDILRLASLNLTSHQFKRISKKEGIRHRLPTICHNPYLLYEEYEPGKESEDELSGEKIDGKIDLFKIDISLMPLAKYQRHIKGFHDFHPTDKRRLRAVVIQILLGRETTGDCFLDVKEITKQAESYSLFYKTDTPYLIEEHLADPDESVDQFFREKLVIRKVNGRNHYYLKKLYDDEVFIRNFIMNLIESDDHSLSAKSLEASLSDSIELLRKKIGIRFDQVLFREERERLYNNIASKSFFVITGFPGAGKSYELLKIIDFLRSHNETHVVLSLTGKAVIRLKNNEEGIRSITAKTIDKFLIEQENAKAQAATSIIHNLIIDESSMVDLPKFAATLRSIDTKNLKRLILVGDPNQLPPIGFGKPFSDVIDMMAEKPDVYNDYGVQLEVNCRAEMSDEFIGFTRIFSNESKFAEGFLSQTAQEGHICNNVLEFVFWRTSEELQSRLSDKVRILLDTEGYKPDQLPSFLGIENSFQKPSKLERFQVLSPYRSGYYGASGLNIHFQDQLRLGVQFERKSSDVVFKLFDKVMHTQNEYNGNELLVSNGSLGAILNNGQVFFVDNEKSMRIDSLRTKNMLELAYAITVHKSQGSGFNHVFIVLPEKAQFTSRELLYTALTRAKNQVTIFLQQGNEILPAPEFFHKIRSKSAVVGRRTSLFTERDQFYAYSPD